MTHLPTRRTFGDASPSAGVWEMNRFVALLNRIRKEADWGWLTESQREASEQLRDFFGRQRCR